MRSVCVTIKTYIVNEPHCIKIRLFTAKQNGDLKQVAYENFTFNERKLSSPKSW